MKYLGIIALLVLCFLCGCSSGDLKSDTDDLLSAARTKLAHHATHSYRFQSFWDNRFASSTYADTAKIIYATLPNSQIGFGFHAASSNFEVLYDGVDELRIDHQKRRVVRTAADEIAQDSTYFEHSMFFLANPRELLTLTEYDQVFDTLIGGQNLRAYATSSTQPSVVQANVDVYTFRYYFIHPITAEVDQITKVTLLGQDTTQVITYAFKDYSFSSEPYSFGDHDRETSLAYRELTTEAAENERLAGLVRPGDQLFRPDYKDITQQEKLLYGTPGRRSLIMFSFIGCGGCEYALREMKKKAYAVRDDLDFYYSSPVDAAPAVTNYLQRKGFPHLAFSKESLMNEQFHVAAFPTFVLIDAQGKVLKVMGGYDDEVAALIFG